MPTCRTCGAAIVWITSPSGRPQIADAEEQLIWVTDEPNPLSATHLVLIDRGSGRIIRGYRARRDMPFAREIRGHVSHWHTCTRPPARQRARR